MQISILRKGSIGLKGTYQNVGHHAKPILNLVRQLASDVPNWGFKEWKQGHNVHVLVTNDGRQFTVRGYQTEDGYIGVQVFFRASRSLEVKLFSIYADYRNGINLDDVSIFMKAFARTEEPSRFEESRQ